MEHKEILLEDKISKLNSELTLLRRKSRQETKEFVSEPEHFKKEYAIRKQNGEKVDPLIKNVDLEELVSSEIFEKVLKINNNLAVNKTKLRSKDLYFYTPNMRSLWQSFGQEFIEPELLDFIDSIPKNGIYFDVGASTGVFAIYAAAMKKKTYCFEPEGTNYNILNINNYLNFKQTQNFFHGFNLAISRSLGTETMFMKHFEPSAHEKILGNNQVRDGSSRFKIDYKQRVLSLSLDQFCEMEKVNPTDIKIDVDGSELDVIKGMKNTLKSPSLRRIFLEVSVKNKNSKMALSKILRSGFKIILKKRVQNYFDDFNYVLERG